MLGVIFYEVTFQSPCLQREILIYESLKGLSNVYWMRTIWIDPFQVKQGFFMLERFQNHNHSNHKMQL